MRARLKLLRKLNTIAKRIVRTHASVRIQRAWRHIKDQRARALTAAIQLQATARRHAVRHAEIRVGSRVGLDDAVLRRMGSSLFDEEWVGAPVTHDTFGTVTDVRYGRFGANATVESDDDQRQAAIRATCGWYG